MLGKLCTATAVESALCHENEINSRPLNALSINLSGGPRRNSSTDQAKSFPDASLFKNVYRIHFI